MIRDYFRRKPHRISLTGINRNGIDTILGIVRSYDVGDATVWTYPSDHSIDINCERIPNELRESLLKDLKPYWANVEVTIGKNELNKR